MHVSLIKIIYIDKNIVKFLSKILAKNIYKLKVNFYFIIIFR